MKFDSKYNDYTYKPGKPAEKNDAIENGHPELVEHSLKFLEMAFRMDKRIIPDNPDGVGKKLSDCGDIITFYIKNGGGRIASVSYDLIGCLNFNACANAVVHLCEGKTLDEVGKVTPDDVIAFLETLPEHETHCAENALEAFFSALEDAASHV